jgi:hypothetical protein
MLMGMQAVDMAAELNLAHVFNALPGVVSFLRAKPGSDVAEACEKAMQYIRLYRQHAAAAAAAAARARPAAPRVAGPESKGKAKDAPKAGGRAACAARRIG